jgi:hypothetical protein
MKIKNKIGMNGWPDLPSEYSLNYARGIEKSDANFGVVISRACRLESVMYQHVLITNYISSLRTYLRSCGERGGVGAIKYMYRPSLPPIPENFDDHKNYPAFSQEMHLNIHLKSLYPNPGWKVVTLHVSVK